jgi:hypothetical protein
MIMKEVVLNVAPAAEGWGVACDLPLEPIFFGSADRAEEAARGLALRLTDLGRDVRLFVRNRLNETTATHRYFSL